MDADRWGIQPGYRDYRGEWRDAPPETVDALRELIGDPGDGSPGPLRLARRGDAVGPPGAEVSLEDGGSLRLDDDGVLPAETPFGYHALDGRRLAVTPGACWLPEDGRLHTWGWSAQLYATRSSASWGIGDLADLRRLASWSAGLGAGMLLVNPLHASLPTVQQPSPYFPSSRCFRNPIYLRVEDERPEAAASLNAQRVIDREAVWKLKLEALEAGWARFRERPDAAFEAFVDEGGAALAGYGAFCALSEVHGFPWQDWPSEVRNPSARGVRSFTASAAGRDRVRFHQWLQWLVDRQLAEAGRELALMQDLAIGCDPAGADAWLWQDTFAQGVRVGAPPDEFNTQGQDWGVPPFDPWRLREAGYEPFVQTLRAGFRHAGGLRADHVMGWFRLYWIPPGAGAADGTYVSYPWRDLLDLVALESHRAGAFVVGEDLGTVEDWVRDELARRHVLSYRLLWFEPGRPAGYPARALAAVTTHDLPTVAGLWSGSDLDEQSRLGLDPNVASTEGIRQRLASWLGVDERAPVDEVVVGAHRVLAEAPSDLLAATLDDALGVEERPNVPGTTDERPNWSLALPKTLEEIEQDPLVAAVASVVGEGRSAPA